MFDPEQRDSILEDALEIPDEPARAAFIRVRCGSDYELLAELERLLRLHHASDDNSFLDDGPDIDLVPRLEPGMRIGRYRIEAEVGSGGAGRVYRARDEMLERPVAVKILFDREGESSRPRFLRELRLLASLSHPNVVQLYDAGEFDGEFVLIMEFLYGQDLGQAIRENRCGSVDRKISIATQMIAGLEHIHRAGIIHRDLKPSNVFLLADGHIKLTDFGIARKVEMSITNPGLTQSGVVAGTPTHLAPEVIKGAKPGFSSDVYALGLTLYELFTGQPAFPRASNMAALLERIVTSTPDFAPLRRAAGAGIADFVAHCMSKTPSARPVNLVQSWTAATTPLWDAAWLASAREALTAHIGPIARVITDRAARTAKSKDALKAALAEEIPSASDRARFLLALKD